VSVGVCRSRWKEVSAKVTTLSNDNDDDACDEMWRRAG
jgi:hypothetical protein